MKLNKVILIVFTGCLFILPAFAIPNGLFKLQVKTAGNKSFNLSELQKNKASVLFFLSPECPLCQNYSLTINQLQKKYKGSGIQLYAVFPGKYYPEKEILKSNNNSRSCCD
jgi:thiol-disulfide isomerase/thioredoxin